MKLPSIPNYFKTPSLKGVMSASFGQRIKMILVAVIIIKIVTTSVSLVVNFVTRILNRRAAWKRFVTNKLELVKGLLEGQRPGILGASISKVFGTRSNYESVRLSASVKHEKDIVKTQNLKYFNIEGSEETLGNRAGCIAIGAKKGAEELLEVKLATSKSLESLCEDSNNLRVSSKVLVTPKDVKAESTKDGLGALLIEDIPKSSVPLSFNGDNNGSIFDYSDESGKYDKLVEGLTDVALHVHMNNLVSLGCASEKTDSIALILANDYRRILIELYKKDHKEPLATGSSDFKLINNTFGRLEVERKPDGSMAGVLMDIDIDSPLDREDSVVKEFLPAVANLVPLAILFPFHVSNIVARAEEKLDDKISFSEKSFLAYVASLGVNITTDVAFVSKGL